MTGVNFGAWADLGKVINAVQWGIASRPFSYPVDGTATVDNGKEVATAFELYSIYSANFSTGSVSLASGTYYLVLQNAVASDGSDAFWDINNGPATASQSGYPLDGSGSFQILGTTIAAVPEAASWAMLIAGFGLVGAAARRRRIAVAA